MHSLADEELVKGPSYAPKPCREYFDWAGSTDWRLRFAADQAKFNLAWLVVPEIETHSVTAIPEGLARSIDEKMSREMRFQLYKQPMKFVEYWNNLFKGDLIPVISIEMPDGYEVTMLKRAKEAQKLFVQEEGNVVKVRFGQRG